VPETARVIGVSERLGWLILSANRREGFACYRQPRPMHLAELFKNHNRIDCYVIDKIR